MTSISPCLWFDGQAEQAAAFYVSLFPDSRIDKVSRAPGDYPGGKKGDALVIEFTLAGRRFLALNGGRHHAFNDAVSMSISADDQAEVDRLWSALVADGGSPGQCGWLKDRWGLSWQVVPSALPRLLGDPDQEAAGRAMQAMMGMSKIDIAELERAAEGGKPMTDTSCYELSITRLIDAPPATVWRVWTERLDEWWAPKPWTTRLIEQDLRPGGRSAMVMSGPEGETSPMEGVLLEVSPCERIVFTNAFKPGWIPQPPFMVGIFEFADEGGRTRYTASARHWDEATMRQHEAMGFIQGWTVVAAQLAALAERDA